MPVTVNASLLGTGRKISIARAAPLSTAGAASVDQLTVNHQLGVCPEVVEWVPRSVVATASGGVPQALLLSWDATKVVIALPFGDGGATSIQIDVTCNAVHTLMR